MMISIIAAISENYVLGKDNKLVWHVPSDQQYYRDTVKGHTIVMGRKTAESVDMFFSDKKNILITRQQDFQKEGFQTANSLQEAIQYTKGEKEVFITGGADIYEQALPITDRLYITKIHATVEGDAFFPNFDSNQWKLLSEKGHPQEGKNEYAYTFLIYERK